MQITHDLGLGGLQQVVVNLCRTIDRDLFDVSVLCLRDLGCFVSEVRELGIKVHFLGQKVGRTDYFSCLKVAKILREERIDVIHTHNTQPLIDGTVGALMSGVKTIVHTDHARDFPDRLKYMFAEWVMSRFAFRVVGVSDHTSKNLMKYEKISPRKIVTIHNGILGSRFEISLNKERKMVDLGIRDRGPVIGLGVRLSEQKGIAYLLKAMPGVAREFPKVTLLIAGEGPLEADLRGEARALGIEANVNFAGPRLDIPELLKVFDLYVLPSVWEGLPMVLLEAMAAGCPILATDVGGVSLAIKSGVNGSLVKPRDPQSLEKEIIRLLRDESLRKKYSENGRRIFRESFSAEAMARKYERLYLRQK
jgi:glycosyltransferase involved in cell wall biosynthesis